MSVYQILILTLTLTLVGLIMILHIVDHQILVKRRRQRKQEIQAYLLQKLQVGEDIRKRYPKRQLYEAYVELVQSIDLSSERKYDAYRLFVSMGLIQRELRRLRSFRSTVRMRAISFLSTFPEKYIVNTLLGMLSTETNERAKTLLAYAVRHRIDDTTLPQLIHSLIGSKRFYQYRMIQMLIRYMPVTLLHMDQYFDRPEIEIKEVFVDLSRKVYHPIFEPLLWKNLKMLEAHLDGHVAQEFVHVQPFRLHRLHKSIMLALSEQFGAVFSDDSHLYHPQPEIVEIAVSTIARSGGSATIEKLMRAASHAASTLPFSDGILRMTEKNQLLYDGLIEWLGKDLSRTDKQVLTRVFRARLNYVLLKLTTRNPIWLDRLIELMMAEGSRTELINFLNMNKDLDLEKRLTKILAEYARTDEELLFELSTYLSSEVYARMGFLKLTLVPQKRKTAKNEISKTKWLIRHLIFSIVFLPLLFVLIRWRIVFLSPILVSAEQYVIFINKVFIGYYLAVNAIYFMLAMLSYFANRRQSALWRLKGHPLLYEPGMIPSVTIIAPAYNEAMSIVDNIHSLLNLDYPDYQVVIVNDGSKDNTLQTVIDHFEMIRVDIPKVASIETRPVKAVYANKSYPNLLMVDKENGGKADALNVGINYATKEYVCGIDADSLLEPDALLRLMSSMLDHDKITIALGGSIIPVNGSMVDKGHIERFGLAKNGLARLQTVEYLRAFNLSRLGFSELHSLLIISGAFGLFEKRILIESGGPRHAWAVQSAGHPLGD